MAEDRLRFYGSSQIRMARMNARREKGISWIRTVLATNRQPNILTNRTRKSMDPQAQRSDVVVPAVAKIAPSPQTARLLTLQSHKVPVLVPLVK